MTSNTDFSTIEHLDFDVTEKPEETCEGYVFADKKANETESNDNCPNSPKIIAIRSCCGLIQRYCLSCYNRICTFHAEHQANGGHGSHRPETNGSSHRVTGPPFNRVEFL